MFLNFTLIIVLSEDWERLKTTEINFLIRISNNINQASSGRKKITVERTVDDKALHLLITEGEKLA